MSVLEDFPRIPPVVVLHAACSGDHGSCDEPDSCKRRPKTALPPRILTAIARCLNCPVLDECRAWALSDRDPVEGQVAGGLTTRQRDDIRNHRKARQARDDRMASRGAA